MSDLISRQDAIDAMWKSLYAYEDLTEKQFMEHKELELGDWFRHRIFVQRMHEECMKAVEALPSRITEYKTLCGVPIEEAARIVQEHNAEPKTVGNTNVNEIYNYLKERIGDIVDDMREFDDWFERMVWHVKECDRLAKETKTGEWIGESDGYADGEMVHDTWYCPFCDFMVETDGDKPTWSFCPNCGARMDGDTESTTK